MLKGHHRRRYRNYFIKRDLQGRYIFWYFIIVLGGSLLFAVILGLFSSDTMTITYDDYMLHVGATPTMLMGKFFAAHWLFLVLGSLLLIVVTTVITHSVAGPLYKFEKYVDSMLEGELGQPLNLRSKDEGRELAEKLDRFSRELAETMKDLNYLSEEIDKQVAASSNFHVCKQIQEINNKIRERLQRYHLDEN